MKKSLFLAFLSLSAFQIHAQETKTLLDGNAEISGFGGFNFGIHTIDGSASASFGGGGAMLLNRTFWLGGFGEGINVNKSYTYMTNEGERVIDLDMGYGGLWTGYKIRPQDVIHPQVDVKLGWGGVSAKDADNGLEYLSSTIFVFLPSAGVEVNITRVFRVQLMAGYRSVSGSDIEFANSSDLSGFVGNFGFVFGWF